MKSACGAALAMGLLVAACTSVRTSAPETPKKTPAAASTSSSSTASASAESSSSPASRSSSASSSSSSSSSSSPAVAQDIPPPPPPVATLLTPAMGLEAGRATGERSAREGSGFATGEGLKGKGAATHAGAHPGSARGSGAAAQGESTGWKAHANGGTGTPGQQPGEGARTHRAQGTETASRPTRGTPRSGSARKSQRAGIGDPDAGNGATARHIPDGRDDDVVASRLRRAAQEERDPRVRAKLWQEYLDYRENVLHKP